MDPYKNAIIITKHDNGYDPILLDKCDEIKSILLDKCDEIKSINRNDKGGYDVTFNNGNKAWPYARKNVRWMTKPTEISLEGKLLFVNGSHDSEAEKVLKFIGDEKPDNKEAWYKVFYKDKDPVSYESKNVCLMTKSTEISLKDNLLFVNGLHDSEAEKVLEFISDEKPDNKEYWYKVYDKDKEPKLHESSDIELKRTIQNQPEIKDSLEYMTEVAEHLHKEAKKKNPDIPSDQLPSVPLLKTITNLRPIEGCFLDKFLRKSKIVVKNSNANLNLIFPFGANYSQMEAVEKAFTSELSVIQGPPGTGKT
ncbi:MAG: hypothetical protein LBE09_02975, partial [Christensenellaceae bacterium]|nr:hypothetical protein [Christensenellaceae bacterium]